MWFFFYKWSGLGSSIYILFIMAYHRTLNNIPGLYSRLCWAFILRVYVACQAPPVHGCWIRILVGSHFLSKYSFQTDGKPGPWDCRKIFTDWATRETPIYNSLCLLIPNFHPFFLHPPSLLATTSLFFMVKSQFRFVGRNQSPEAEFESYQEDERCARLISFNLRVHIWSNWFQPNAGCGCTWDHSQKKLRSLVNSALNRKPMREMVQLLSLYISPFFWKEVR